MRVSNFLLSRESSYTFLAVAFYDRLLSLDPLAGSLKSAHEPRVTAKARARFVCAKARVDLLLLSACCLLSLDALAGSLNLLAPLDSQLGQGMNSCNPNQNAIGIAYVVLHILRC